MSIEFLRVDPDLIPFKGLSYLESSVNKSPDGKDLWETIQEAKSDGEIYIISNGEIIGCMYVQIFPDLLNIIHLGGELKPYRDDVVSAFKKFMRDRNIRHLCLLSRVGWNRLFKELKPIGTFYHYDDGGPVETTKY